MIGFRGRSEGLRARAIPIVLHVVGLAEPREGHVTLLVLHMYDIVSCLRFRLRGICTDLSWLWRGFFKFRYEGLQICPARLLSFLRLFPSSGERNAALFQLFAHHCDEFLRVATGLRVRLDCLFIFLFPCWEFCCAASRRCWHAQRFIFSGLRWHRLSQFCFRRTFRESTIDAYWLGWDEALFFDTVVAIEAAMAVRLC